MADEVKISVGPDANLQALMVAKDLTRRTQILTELQAQQLRLWPLAILNAKSSQAGIDFEKKVVKFKLKGFEGERPPDLGERIANLRKCVQFLLGSEYRIQVRDGKERLDTPG